MKGLFIQGGSKVKVNSKNEYYMDGNFNDNILNDYSRYFDSIIFIFRRDIKIYEDDYLENNFNKIDKKFRIVLVDDLYISIFSFIDIKKRKRIMRILVDELSNVDKVIIRSMGNYYTNFVYKYCKKNNIQYMLEITGFIFENIWYHSFLGKFFATFREVKMKHAAYDASLALYVTSSALQKRYPCKNMMRSCSDVRIDKTELAVLNRRIERIRRTDCKYLSIATIGFVDVKWKGQKDVIKAISKLNKIGYHFTYYLVGSGNRRYLQKLVNNYHLEKEVIFVDPMKHSEIFNFLDSIDIYLQPSYQEGLCRSIVEAMSRGLPVVCSNVGGNFELIEKRMMYNKKNVNQLIDILSSLHSGELETQSIVNFKKAEEYYQRFLMEKRERIYLEYIK